MRIQTGLTRPARPAPGKRAPEADTPSQDQAPGETVLLSTALVGGTGAAVVALSDTTRVDKYKHMGIVGATTIALGTLGLPPAAAAALSFGAATVGKELLFDLALGRGTPSLLDTAANFSGAAAGYLVLKAAQHKES